MINIFDGIKILDFSWILAGPLTVRYFSSHGATVIKVESITQPDMLRTSAPFKDGKPGLNRSGAFASINYNKYSFNLNLNNPKALPIAHKLVQWADIVSENFAPGRMEKWGLGYEDLKKIKPDIIMLRNSNQGQTGPHATRRGFGILLTSQLGFNSVTGWPDRGPNTSYLGYTDFIAPHFAAVALIAALIRRKKTGEGQCIDISQAEASIHFLSPVYLDYKVNGNKAQRMGNASPYAVPHGAFPSWGEDRWVAISVSSDSEWESFCDVMGNPPWSSRDEFSTLAGRKRHEDELNERISQWTVTLKAEEAMLLLQGAGVPAGVVEDTRDIFEDAQLRSRDCVKWMQTDEMGLYPYVGPSVCFSETPADIHIPAPNFGEHTQMICQDILGISDEEFVELINEGVLE